jgi:hypothetical protein
MTMKFIPVRHFIVPFAATAFFVAFGAHRQANSHSDEIPRAHLGFDRNIYPGDAALPVLRETFTFTSYWLSPAPGERTNTWFGKHKLLHSRGFGFVVLYRGRDSREFKKSADATQKGTIDASNAATAAKNEGFSRGTIIFLDIEEGGRLPGLYHAYVRAWADALLETGYRPGVYCSGMPVDEGGGVSIITADDIRNNVGRGKSSIGFTTTPARRHPAAAPCKTRHRLPRAAYPTPQSGNSRNLPAAGNSPSAARSLITRMATVTPPVTPHTLGTST